jgi:hypothetical protein
MAVSIPVVMAAVVCAVAVPVTVADVGSVAFSLVAASVIGNALVIGDASYGGAGVSAYNADEGVWAVGVPERICAKGAEAQSARDEKSGKRSFDRRTHDKLPFFALQQPPPC